MHLSGVHAKQLFTHLKLLGLKLGYVLNFGGNLTKDGIERIVNGLPEERKEKLCVLASLRESPAGAVRNRQTRLSFLTFSL